MGWTGQQVKHADGRTGRIAAEYIGFLHAVLTIVVDGGGESRVQLNTNGRDTGEPGWQWFCENFSGGPRWLQLGDMRTA